MRIVKNTGSVSTALNYLHTDKSLKQGDALLSLKLISSLEYVIVMKGEIHEGGMELNKRYQRLVEA
jgi:hypothetical protein